MNITHATSILTLVLASNRASAGIQDDLIPRGAVASQPHAAVRKTQSDDVGDGSLYH